MTTDEAGRVTKLAKGLWQAMTPEQVGYMTETLIPFQYDRAVAVVKNCAANGWSGLPHDQQRFFHLSGLVEALRSDEQKHRDFLQGRERVRIIDWARREYAEFLASSPASNWDDRTVLEWHFGQAWLGVKAS